MPDDMTTPTMALSSALLWLLQEMASMSGGNDDDMAGSHNLVSELGHCGAFWEIFLAPTAQGGVQTFEPHVAERPCLLLPLIDVINTLRDRAILTGARIPSKGVTAIRGSRAAGVDSKIMLVQGPCPRHVRHGTLSPSHSTRLAAMRVATTRQDQSKVKRTCAPSPRRARRSTCRT